MSSPSPVKLTQPPGKSPHKPLTPPKVSPVKSSASGDGTPLQPPKRDFIVKILKDPLDHCTPEQYKAVSYMCGKGRLLIPTNLGRYFE
eukprot:gene1086-6025_t